MFVRESPMFAKGKPIDWWGILLLAIGVGSLQVVLEKGETEDWFQTPYIAVAYYNYTILSGIGFVWRELSTDHPVVDFRILKRPKLCNRYYYFICAWLRVIWLGIHIPGILSEPITFYRPANRIDPVTRWFGYHSYDAFCRRHVKERGAGPVYGNRWVLSCSLCSVGCYRTVHLESGTGDFFWPLIIRGIGMAILFVPLTTLAVQGLQGKQIGQGYGFEQYDAPVGWFIW